MTSDPANDDALSRRRRAVLAGHTGDATTAAALLDDADPGVRAGALGALARTGTLTADQVHAALADASPIVRRRAAEEAIAHPDVDLRPLLDDDDATVVEAAAFALGEREDPIATAALARTATTHDDPLCREAAVAALGAIGDPAGLPAVLAATEDKPAVRRRAVLALAPFEGPEVDAALARALTDRDWQVRQAAEDLTREDPPEGGSSSELQE